MKILQKIKMFFTMLFNKDIFCARKKLVAYICGTEVLPEPLTEIEEKECLLKASRGDEDARAMLIERNLRLVIYIAKKFENTGVELDDLVSIGSVGLIKAVTTFNFEKNIKLATYASRCIENEILMHLRKVTKQKLEVSLDEPLNFDKDGNELLLADVLVAEGESTGKDVELNAEKQMIKDAISKLHIREQTIMTLRFGLNGKEEMTQKEVADCMGISQSYISRIEKKILVKLKKDLEKIV